MMVDLHSLVLSSHLHNIVSFTLEKQTKQKLIAVVIVSMQRSVLSAHALSTVFTVVFRLISMKMHYFPFSHGSANL